MRVRCPRTARWKVRHGRMSTDGSPCRLLRGSIRSAATARPPPSPVASPGVRPAAGPPLSGRLVAYRACCTRRRGPSGGRPTRSGGGVPRTRRAGSPARRAPIEDPPGAPSNLPPPRRERNHKEDPISATKLLTATALALVALGAPLAHATSAFPPGPTAIAASAVPPGPSATIADAFPPGPGATIADAYPPGPGATITAAYPPGPSVHAAYPPGPTKSIIAI